jgi:hypothetical protein
MASSFPALAVHPCCLDLDDALSNRRLLLATGRKEQRQPGSESGHPRTDLDPIAHALEKG